MTATPRKQELEEVKEKVRGARDAALSDTAGAREKADLKLLEAEAAGKKLRAADEEKGRTASKAHGVEGKLDKALTDSFPASDPVSFVQAAPIKKEDRALSTVPTNPPDESKSAKKDDKKD